jgi:hypothetical protein
MNERPWTFKVTCPHGLEYDQPFEKNLGYALRPVACPDTSFHDDLVKMLAPKPPGRIAAWLATRRFRKQLERGDSWPSS